MGCGVAVKQRTIDQQIKELVSQSIQANTKCDEFIQEPASVMLIGGPVFIETLQDGEICFDYADRGWQEMMGEWGVWWEMCWMYIQSSLTVV